MPRYYCDYCDTYLTHDSPSVRKQHNAGYKHKANVRSYYQQFEEQQTQSLIDQRIKEHLGQAAALQQVGAAYAAWQRARPPVLPTPILPVPLGPNGAPLPPGFRPPVLPRPPVPGPPPGNIYGAPPQMAPPSVPGPPNVPGAPMSQNGPTQPPSMNTSGPGPTSNPGAARPPFSGPPPPQHMYQAGPPGSAPMAPPPSFTNPGNGGYPPTSAAESFSSRPSA